MLSQFHRHPADVVFCVHPRLTSTRATYGRGYWLETRTTSETFVTVTFIASVISVALMRLGGAAAYTGETDQEYVTLIMWDLFFFCMACITGWMYILFSTLRVRVLADGHSYSWLLED